jgi:predicted HTH transcriptional regulator
VAELDEVFRALLSNPKETRTRDNKSRTGWPPPKTAGRLNLVRDIIAFSNTRDGGTLVFGVENGTHHFVGLTDEELKSFDKSMIYEALKTFASPVPDFDVERCQLDGNWYVAMLVREFTDIPTICRQSAEARVGTSNPKLKTVLRCGSLYVRTEGAQTVEIDSEHLMRELLDLAVRRKGDGLLRQISDLIPPQLRSTQSTLGDNPYASDISAARRDFTID